MSSLVPIAPTVGKLIRLLASDRDGEVIASARALRRVLRAAGLDLHDLANAIEVSPPAIAPNGDRHWQAMARRCSEHAHLLSARERAFVANMARARMPPSERQLTWLAAILARIEVAA